jgi:ribosomal protein S6
VENSTELETKEAKTYELGYLLTPFLPLEKVEETVDAMYKSLITDLGGEIVIKHLPKMRTLAYPVAKIISNKKSLYQEAYFSAVKFQLSPDRIRTQQEMLEKDGNVLRFLVVNIPKRAERVVVPRSSTLLRRPRPVTPAEEKADKGPEMTSEQIDKEIEGLLDSPTA